MAAPEVTPVEVVHGDGIDRGRIDCRCLELDEAACTAVQKTAPVAIFPKGRVCKRPPLPKRVTPLPMNRTVAIRGPPASWYGRTTGSTGPGGQRPASTIRARREPAGRVRSHVVRPPGGTSWIRDFSLVSRNYWSLT